MWVDIFVCVYNSASTSDGGEDTEFRTAVRILADRVANLVQQRAELLERCSVAEANQAHLNKELEKQTEILKTLYSKRNSDKQVCIDLLIRFH